MPNNVLEKILIRNEIGYYGMPFNEKPNKSTVTEENLDTLQWAKEFMERYEKKHGITI